MIIREFYKMREDGINLYKTYSDSNVVIRKVNTNEKYNIAIDMGSTNTIILKNLYKKNYLILAI